jgi:hypothetical protein
MTGGENEEVLRNYARPFDAELVERPSAFSITP